VSFSLASITNARAPQYANESDSLPIISIPSYSVRMTETNSGRAMSCFTLCHSRRSSATARCRASFSGGYPHSAVFRLGRRQRTQGSHSSFQSLVSDSDGEKRTIHSQTWGFQVIPISECLTQMRSPKRHASRFLFFSFFTPVGRAEILPCQIEDCGQFLACTSCSVTFA
jgi:hypothetical protein